MSAEILEDGVVWVLCEWPSITARFPMLLAQCLRLRLLPHRFFGQLIVIRGLPTPEQVPEDTTGGQHGSSKLRRSLFGVAISPACHCDALYLLGKGGAAAQNLEPESENECLLVAGSWTAGRVGRLRPSQTEDKLNEDRDLTHQTFLRTAWQCCQSAPRLFPALQIPQAVNRIVLVRQKLKLLGAVSLPSYVPPATG